MKCLNEQTSDKVVEWMVKSEEIHKLNKHKYILKNFQSPGDILMLTACARDIKKWYPDIELGVDTNSSDLWGNNPNITLDKDDPTAEKLDMHYDIINQSGQNTDCHFVHGFIHDFNTKTGCMVKLTNFKADVYLTEEEKSTPVFEDQPDEFVVFIAGGKDDYKTKWWWKEAWNEVITECPDLQFIQVGKNDEKSHSHDRIEADNCINKLGKTDIRQLLRLVYQSSGTLSVVTALMHMAAIFDKHAAVIAGGHEPWWWEKES